MNDMTTDTAHLYWNREWQKADGTSPWAQAEPWVTEHAASLPPGSRILDLGAGIGRHALAFARAVGEYGSVVFISGNMPFRTEITPLLIMTRLEQFDYAGAAALGTVMLLISFLLLLLINLLQHWSNQRHGAGK